MIRVGGSISQVDVSALAPGRIGIFAAIATIGWVDIFGLSCPAFVVGFIRFRLFVVVGQAAASEPVLFSVVARASISALFSVLVQVGASAPCTSAPLTGRFAECATITRFMGGGNELFDVG